MSIYREELLSSRLDIDALEHIKLKPFLDMLYHMFKAPHYLLTNGLMVSKFIVTCPKVEPFGLCVDVAKLYDTAFISKKKRLTVEVLLKINQIPTDSASHGTAPRPYKNELRAQFVINSLYYMGLLVSKLSIERGKTLDEMEKDSDHPLL